MNRLNKNIKDTANKLNMLLADQGGDLYFQKMILVVICFVIGGLILSSLYAVFDSSFADRLSEIFEQILTW
ncbi:MAG: hypothetical protein GX257_05465 [Clostridiales bacterium]|nr:hypothetical protein [Clostridiales bacterium]